MSHLRTLGSIALAAVFLAGCSTTTPSVEVHNHQQAYFETRFSDTILGADVQAVMTPAEPVLAAFKSLRSEGTAVTTRSTGGRYASTFEAVWEPTGNPLITRDFRLNKVSGFKQGYSGKLSYRGIVPLASQGGSFLRERSGPFMQATRLELWADHGAPIPEQATLRAVMTLGLAQPGGPSARHTLECRTGKYSEARRVDAQLEGRALAMDCGVKDEKGMEIFRRKAIYLEHYQISIELVHATIAATSTYTYQRFTVQ